MVSPVDQRKVVGSTVHAKLIHVMAESECQRLYGSQNKVNMVEGVIVVNVDQQITKQRRNQFYVIADYKNPDGRVKRDRLHINSVVEGPVLVPVSVNLPATAPLVTATTTTIIPANISTSVPANPSDHFDPAPVPTTTTTTAAPEILPTTTTAPANIHTTVAPTPDPTTATTVPANPHTLVVSEPDTTTSTCIYANLHTETPPYTLSNSNSYSFCLYT